MHWLSPSAARSSCKSVSAALVYVDKVTNLIRIFAIVPAVSRTLVAKSMLMIQALQVLEPTPTSFRLIMNATLYHATTFAPTLDAFNVSLYSPLNNPKMIAFSSSLVPSLVALPRSNINLEQYAPILDIDQFTDFARKIVTMEELELGVIGKTTLRLGPLPPVPVDFEQTLKLKGVLGFRFYMCIINLLSRSKRLGWVLNHKYEVVGEDRC